MLKKSVLFTRRKYGYAYTKPLLKMKFSFIFLLVFMVQVNAASYAQKVSLSARDATLEEVFGQLKAQSGYDFLYSSQALHNTGKVNIQVKNTDLSSVLEKCLSNQDLTYVIHNKTVVIKRKTAVTPESPLQNRKVTGSVTDEKGQPLLGVSIKLKGTSIGVVTDATGKFSLTVPGDNSVLVFSYIGYITQEVAVQNNSTVNVSLKEQTSSLNQVVVVGYGTQKKVNLTGAVSVVRGADLETRPVVDATQSLQGMVPGLNVNVSGNTKPGQSFGLNVRGMGNLSGTDKPYVLVDGLEMPLSDVNPNDIESISVLKDAAASAIYGSRAAYGVILVTTKRGTSGKTLINYSSNAGLTSPIKLPDMVNSLEFAKYFNAATFNALGTKQYTDAKLALLEQYIKDPSNMSVFPEVNSNNYADWENSSNGVANTNWFKLHYKPYAFRQNHNISLSGGNQATQFYVSGGYYGEGGTLRFADIDFKRYNFNASVTSQLASWIKIKANTKYTKSSFETPFAGFEDMIFHNLARMRPNVSAYDLNGNWTEQSMIPYLQSGSKSQTDNTKLALLTGVEITPLKNWKIFVDVNLSQLNTEASALKLPGTIYGIDGTPIMVNRAEYNIPPKGSYSRDMMNTLYISPNIYSTYAYSLHDTHNFELTAGFQQESNQYKSLSASAQDLISNERPGINLATGTKLVTESRTHWATQGFFGRLAYNYKEKFLAEVNGRYDGSSRFATDSRWGFFPSFSAGYNISKENFIQDIAPWLDLLKIRGSYGFLGNQAGAGLYSFSENMNVVVPGIGSGGNWYYNTGRESYIQLPGSFNPFITWEKIENTNVGLDFMALQGRLSGSFDVYQRNTRDMLGPTLDVADMYGATPPLSNNADLRTRGWELSLSWKGRISNDITYTAGALVADYKSVVTKYQNPTKSDPANSWYEGKAAGEIWGYRASGLIQDEHEAAEYNQLDRSFLSARDWLPGDVKYIDLNNDGKINRGANKEGDMGDMTIIGNSTPRYSYSVNGSLSWKRLTLSMIWQGIGKMDFAPQTTDAYFWGSGSLAQVTVFKQHLDYWTPENPNAYYPNPYASPVGSINSYVNKTQQVSDRYLQNAAYLRLKNLTLNYALPVNLCERIKLKKLNVFITGENLLTVTNLAEMFDPETLVGGSAPGKIYPLSKVYSVGLNINF
ncbi:TonB-dependent receptor [Chitinophaga sp. MM2321]|uniref:TonB-dependent receptor n=1 Tax=Chitinophaga sp. MM2321 TaxID=3137178 RepID=UPI0032D59104